MSTIYLIDRETALTAPAADDVYLVYDASAGVTKKIAHTNMQKVIVTLATSNGTSISNNGLTVISTSGGTSHTLADPVEGCVKTLVSNTAGTGTTVTVNFSSTSITVNAAGGSVVFNGPNTAITMIGQSATQWIVASDPYLGTGASAATVTFGTS